MGQSTQPDGLAKKAAHSCPTCDTAYEPTIAFCPVDGTKLAERLVDTQQRLKGVAETGNQGNQERTSDGFGHDTVITGGSAWDGPQNTGKPEEMIGRIIDARYRIEGIIGSGGMSVVYN